MCRVPRSQIEDSETVLATRSHIITRLAGDFHGIVDLKGADSSIALLKYVSTMMIYSTNETGETRDTSIEVSNLGAY